MLHLKKNLFSLIVLLSFFIAAHAGDTLYYVGNISLGKKNSYKYILRFAIDTANHITGYSLTDPQGPNEIKARINGTYDSAAKKITFEENLILRPKQIDPKNVCFVQATLKLKHTNLVEMLSGDFTGVQPGNANTCAAGSIKLINTDRPKRLMAEMERIQNIRNNKNSNNATEDESKGDVIKVFTEKPRELDFTGDYVKFILWDNGRIDGDRVSVMVNGKYIIQNYMLDSFSKVIEMRLPATNTIDTVKIIALNEGDVPPNTGIVQIESKTEQYPIEVQAKLNEIRTIYLRRRKK